MGRRVRESAGQVGGEVVVEHGVLRTERQQHRAPDVAQARCDIGDRPLGGVSWTQRDVVDEVRDGRSRRRSPVRRPERLPIGLGDPATGQPNRSLDERRGAAADEVEDRRPRSQPDDPRSRPALGHGDSRVAQDHAGDLTRILHDPSHGDRPAPVVCRDHQRRGRPRESERNDDVVQIAHPVVVATAPGSLAVAHPQLIDREHPIPRAETAEERRPRVPPRRVAVHTQHRRGRCVATLRNPRVEHVPSVTAAELAGHVQEPGPTRVEPPASPVVVARGVELPAGCRRLGRVRRSRHQTISVKLVFRPEPIPMHSTRSPTWMRSATLASVIGIAAGPTLP